MFAMYDADTVDKKTFILHTSLHLVHKAPSLLDDLIYCGFLCREVHLQTLQ